MALTQLQAEFALTLIDGILDLIESDPFGGHCLYNDLPGVDWQNEQVDDAIRFIDGSRLVVCGGEWEIDHVELLQAV